MANSAQNQNSWTATQAYVLAVICLAVGIALGYFIRGSASPAPTTTASTSEVPAGMGQGQMGPGQLQAIPDQQSPEVVEATVQPLLNQLKTDPNNFQLLVQVGNTYYDHSVYTEAVKYYDRALKINNKNADVWTDMGTAYFYMGDSNKAIDDFKEALKVTPNHSNALFNMGIVKWQGLKDPKGAIQAWDQLLKTNPAYPNADKVKELIERAKAHGSMG